MSFGLLLAAFRLLLACCGGLAIRLRGSDPEMEFAAALITLGSPERDHRDHVQKAMAGAKTDPLLAQNLASNFNRQTISTLLTRGTAEGLKQ